MRVTCGMSNLLSCIKSKYYSYAPQGHRQLMTNICIILIKTTKSIFLQIHEYVYDLHICTLINCAYGISNAYILHSYDFSFHTMHTCIHMCISLEFLTHHLHAMQTFAVHLLWPLLSFQFIFDCCVALSAFRSCFPSRLEVNGVL